LFKNNEIRKDYRLYFLFKNNEIRKDYRLYFFVLSFFGPTLNQRRGIQKQNTTIQTISKNYNSTKKLFLKNYNHGSSIVDRQFLASSPF